MTVQDSLVLENVQGRAFVHGMGAGAAVLLVERDGRNISLLLEPDDVAKLGRFCTFALAEQRRQAETLVVDVAETEPHEPRALPSGPRRPPKPRSRPSGSRSKTPPRRDSNVDYEAVGRAFVEAPGDYVSERLGKWGALAYVADQFGIPWTSASARITRARRLGFIPHGFQSASGRGQLPTVRATNGQAEPVGADTGSP